MQKYGRNKMVHKFELPRLNIHTIDKINGERTYILAPIDPVTGIGKGRPVGHTFPRYSEAHIVRDWYNTARDHLLTEMHGQGRVDIEAVNQEFEEGRREQEEARERLTKEAQDMGLYDDPEED